MEPVYKFRKTSDHQYHSALPARDLTEDDVKALDKDQLALLESSPLYRKLETPDSHPPAEASRRPTAPRSAQAGG